MNITDYVHGYTHTLPGKHLEKPEIITNLCERNVVGVYPNLNNNPKNPHGILNTKL
jgi:hypothetical protein